MKKKILTILLATTFVLTACGSTATPSVSDVKNVSSEVVEKDTETTNTVVSNKNAGSSGSSSVAESNKETSDVSDTTNPSVTEQTTEPTLNTVSTEPEKTTENAKLNNEPKTPTTSNVPVVDPEKEVPVDNETSSESVTELDIAQNGTLSASVVMPSYTIAESTNLADGVVEQVCNSFSGTYWYTKYSDHELAKPIIFTFTGNYDSTEKRDGIRYITIHGNEYRLDVSDGNYDYFTETNGDVPMPDENSKYVNFANGAVGFTLDGNTVYACVYDVYMQVMAMDGEMTDQDALDIANNMSLYCFTKEQVLVSRYADLVK